MSSVPISPSPFSAAPTIQPEAAFGLWRRWHSKIEVPLLLQQHAMEQDGGLGWLSFPRELGQSRCPCHLCPQVALAALPAGGDLPAGTALGWGTHEVLQPYMFVYPCLCVLVSLREEAAVWARLSSLHLVLPGGKGSPGAHAWGEAMLPSGYPLLSLAPCPGTPSLWFLPLLL